MSRITGIVPQPGVWLWLLVVLFMGCSDSRKIVDSDSFPFRTSEDQFIAETRFPVAEFTTTIDRPRGEFTLDLNGNVLGTVPVRLLLGSHAEYSSNILLGFIPTTGTGGDSLYLSGTLFMGSLFIWGDPVPGLTAMLHEIESTTPWSEGENEQIRNIQWKSEPFAEMTIGIDSVSTDSVDIPPALMQKWLDGGRDVNKGFVIVGDHLPFLREYLSLEQSTQPFPSVNYEVITVGGDTVRRTVLLVEDVHAVRNTVQEPVDRLQIDAQIVSRIAMKFDLSGIPRTATINEAILLMELDPAGSNRRFPNADPDALQEAVFVYQSLTDDLQHVENDFLPTQILAGVLQGTQLRANVTDLVQFWTAERGINQGLLIISATELQDITRLQFFTSAETDTSRVPRLRLEYFISGTTEGF